MFRFDVVFVHFVLVIIFVSSVSCLSERDRHAIELTMAPIVDECVTQCELKDPLIVTEKGRDVHPCVKKCAARKLKVIDDKGQLDREVMHELFKKYVENEAESVYKHKLFEECFDAQNGSVVEDSEAELNRVEIMMQCLRALMN